MVSLPSCLLWVCPAGMAMIAFTSAALVRTMRFLWAFVCFFWRALRADLGHQLEQPLPANRHLARAVGAPSRVCRVVLAMLLMCDGAGIGIAWRRHAA